MDLHLRPWHVFGVLRDFAVHLNWMQDQERKQALHRQAVFALSQPQAKEIASAEILKRMDALGHAAMRYWLQIMKLVQVIYRRKKASSIFTSASAVMGSGNATGKIRSGQTITVYGSEGEVRLD